MIRVISIFLVLMLLVQTLITASDIHHFIENEELHLTTIDRAEPAAAHAIDNDAPLSKKSPPCEHCCHCHGGCTVFLIGTPCLITPTLFTQKIVTAHSTFSSFFPSPDFRPPII